MIENRLNLLIIEDSEEDTRLLLRQLDKSGYALSWERVESAEEMLSALDRKEWDLVISDYVMPGFSGLEAIRLLKVQEIDIPFIMVSGKEGEEVAVEAMRAGAHDYLLKHQLARLSPAIDRELADAADRRQRRKAERELILLRQAMEAISLGVTITDTEGTIIYTNPAEARMHGYEVAELIGEHSRTLAPEECWGQYGCNGGRGLQIRECLNIRSDGTIFPVQITTSKVYDSEGKPIGVASVSEDITDRKKSEERLRYLSTHDSLTGLYNRTYFEEELRRLEKSRLLPISVIMVDVDGLKKVNDLKGHGCGDLLLQKAARILTETFRNEDMVARIGGDEFIAILPETDYQAAERAVERIRETLREERKKAGETAVSLSLGAATSFITGTLVSTIKLADVMMYRDKASRRGQSIPDQSMVRCTCEPSLLLGFNHKTA